jgi:DUF1009 family protein
VQSSVCGLRLLQLTVGQTQKQCGMTRPHGGQGRLQRLQSLHGLLRPVIDEMDDTVIKACRIAQMVELGVDLRRVGSTTVEGHAEYEFDGPAKRLSGSSKGVLRQITAA